ncbi:hypothetical protein EPR50_G00071650 [Perca flavescens]|uniref:Uncharacterized protein n=1 Tax=Perca flavescens TaxID=8167 RepID=A0A484D463_PERFV|nr:hypothetical protein EPR50_G00071650 [Perca flavescens]
MDLSIAMMTKIFNGQMWKAAIFPVITLNEPDEMDQDEEPCSTSKPSCDAQTQWSDPEEDHTYSKRPTITCRMSSLLHQPQNYLVLLQQN